MSTIRQLADSLVTLLDVCKGLTARTHFLIGYQRPVILDSQVERVCSKLRKKWAAIPDGIERTTGHEIFSDRSIEILASLEDFYMHVYNIYRFKHEALRVLTNISARLGEFSFDTHKDVMGCFFDLFVGTAQLLILSKELPDTQEFTIVYAYAWQLSKATHQPEWGKVQSIVTEMGDPIQSLRDECGALGPHIGKSLASVAVQYYSNSNIEAWVDNGCFDPLKNPVTLGLCETDPFYRDYIFTRKFQSWVLYGYLLCPSELQDENSRYLLEFVCGDSFFLHISRTRSLPLHDVFDKLFAEYTNKTFKLSKYKAIVREAATVAVRDAPVMHASVRNFLRAKLRVLIALLKDFNGVVGPKIDIVYAAIAMAKDEIIWFFKHLGKEPPRSKAKYQGEDWLDDNISQIFMQMDQLCTLVRENNEVLRTFSLESLKTLLPDLKVALEEVSQTSSIKKEVQDIVQVIVQSIEEANVNTNFGAMRHEWMVCLMILSESGSSSRASKNLTIVMNNVVHHSRNCDMIEAQLTEFGSLHELWYDLDTLTGLFNDTLTKEGRQPEDFIAILKILHSSTNNFHMFCPEEQEFIATQSTRVADFLLTSLADTMRDVCRDMYDCEIFLLRQIIPQQAAARLRDKLNGVAVSPFPGFESGYSKSRKIGEIKAMRLTQNNIASLCTAIRNVPHIRVFNTLFYPREYIFDMIVDELRTRFRELMINQKGYERPSIFFLKLRCLFSSFDCVSTHLNIELAQAAQFVLLSENFDSKVPPCGEVVNSAGRNILDVDLKDKSKAPLGVHEFALLYVEFLTTQLDNVGIIFSDIDEGFVNISGAGNQAPSGVRARNVFKQAIYYAQTSELAILCKCIGPYGVRFLERQLLSLVAAEVGGIKGILDLNKITIHDTTPRLTQTNVWFEGYRKIKQLDKLMAHAMRIAIVLKFRAMLCSAFAQTLAEQVPHITTMVTRIYERLADSIFADDLKGFCALAADIGVSPLGTDPGFLSILKQFKITRADADLWNLLPEQFGYLFVSKIWKDANFIISLNAHDNNGHCISETIQALITGFSCIQVS